MRKHLKATNIAVMSVICLLGMTLAAPGASAQDSPLNVARVSFVQGSVQLLAGQGNDFQQAVMNMPVVDGSRLQTGGDGQAEVEFGDGSVARLTPNSTLEFDHLGQDQVQLQQLGGLGYYEFNVGQGHPAFNVQFANLNMQPATNSIVRVGLDAGWDVAVINGGINVQGQGTPGVNVSENQSIRTGADNSGAPYTVAQGINGDSWDNWNQDRDQAIAQEASQQTPVRDDAANPQSENWNDLDADGNWYPVEGEGNVWVPAGVGPGWDPYGAGYWAYYPTFGYTWISSYPWGWLPYHSGSWNYYSFGWGWSPGRNPGRTWAPVTVVRVHPPGWSMPLYPPGGARPLPGRLVVVDRGPAAKGPWAFNHGTAPRPDHQQALNWNGRTITPIGRTDVRPQAFSGARGTAPGSRAVLGGTFPGPAQRPGPSSTYLSGYNSSRPVGTQNVRPPVGPALTPPQGAIQRPPQGMNPRPNVAYPPAQSYNQRSNYEARPTPTTHYSAPPPPHYSAPPQQQHYSAPPQAQHQQSIGPRR
jgi:FecR protein